MKTRSAVFLPLLLAALLAGCGGKSYVALLESPDGTTGKVVVRGDKGEQVIDRKMQAVPIDGSAPPAPISEETLKRDFGAAMAARPLLPERFLLYFESGGAQLTAESAALLPRIVASVTERPAVDVSIIGHSDTVGKADANEALALKRAAAVAEMLKAQGLRAHALSVESHGERNLLVATPDETPEPRNRRVEISVR